MLLLVGESFCLLANFTLSKIWFDTARMEILFNLSSNLIIFAFRRSNRLNCIFQILGYYLVSVSEVAFRYILKVGLTTLDLRSSCRSSEILTCHKFQKWQINRCLRSEYFLLEIEINSVIIWTSIYNKSRSLQRDRVVLLDFNFTILV